MTHVVIVGAGIAGLLAAHRAVQAGHRVTVLEAAAHAGGAIQPVDMTLPEGTLTVDAGAEAFAARSGAVAELIDELGLTDQLVTPDPAGSWLYLPQVGAVAAPKLGLWGIPGDPSAPEVVAAIGRTAAARAAQDLERPMDDWAKRVAAGDTVTVGELVADRFGDAVLARLVAPVVAGVHSADPHNVAIDTIAPGLLAKAIEHNSVAKAVAQLRAAAPPGAAVTSLTGGMHRLVTALLAALQPAAKIRYNTPVTALDLDTRTVHTADGTALHADHLVLAVNAPTAFDLLAPDTGLTQRPEVGAGVALAVLVVDDPALDASPRGTGMLVSPEATHIGAKAATHVTAKWDWAARAATALAPHRHVIRLSYGRITDPADGSAPGYPTNDADLLQLARADLAALFGLDTQRADRRVIDSRLIRWRNAMPLVTPDNAARVTAVAEAAAAHGWLGLTGAWFAGTGLAAITTHVNTLKFPTT